MLRDPEKYEQRLVSITAAGWWFVAKEVGMVKDCGTGIWVRQNGIK